jgi:hypothetical protein
MAFSPVDLVVVTILCGLALVALAGMWGHDDRGPDDL